MQEENPYSLLTKYNNPKHDCLKNKLLYKINFSWIRL